jgi:hypothetical protein
MIEVLCPVTGEVSEFPDHRAYMARPLRALAAEFQIPVEDIWTMVKIAAEKGQDWLDDSLEYWDLVVAITNDHQQLKLSRQGLLKLSIIELTDIYWRCYRSLMLELEHETNPKTRAKLEVYLREMEEVRQRTIELAMPILAPEVRRCWKRR